MNKFDSYTHTHTHTYIHYISVSKCNESRCDICENYMVFKSESTCTVTGETYKVKGDLLVKVIMLHIS